MNVKKTSELKLQICSKHTQKMLKLNHSLGSNCIEAKLRVRIANTRVYFGIM